PCLTQLTLWRPITKAPRPHIPARPLPKPDETEGGSHRWRGTETAEDADAALKIGKHSGDPRHHTDSSEIRPLNELTASLLALRARAAELKREFGLTSGYLQAREVRYTLNSLLDRGAEGAIGRRWMKAVIKVHTACSDSRVRQAAKQDAASIAGAAAVPKQESLRPGGGHRKPAQTWVAPNSKQPRWPDLQTRSWRGLNGSALAVGRTQRLADSARSASKAQCRRSVAAAASSNDECGTQVRRQAAGRSRSRRPRRPLWRRRPTFRDEAEKLQSALETPKIGGLGAATFEQQLEAERAPRRNASRQLAAARGRCRGSRSPLSAATAAALAERRRGPGRRERQEARRATRAPFATLAACALRPQVGPGLEKKFGGTQTQSSRGQR
uniref:DUF4476 domain-containing protein n=1 Tax=Macrostomum lignano TaxID=282301 RepID=A0A1I8FGJ5_9PLAT